MECLCHHLLLNLLQVLLFICQVLVFCPGSCAQGAAALSASSPNNPSPSPDTQALLEFQHLLKDPWRFLSNWDQSGATPTCEWRGVSCDQSLRVTALDLSQAHLSGFLPDSALSKLDRLQNLSLRGNNFYGNLTGSFLMSPDHYCTLQYLDLSSNALNGTINGSILTSCGSLLALNLSHNHLGGELIIPTQVKQEVCRMLRILDLSGNKFSGEVPPGLDQFCSLQMLDSSSNQLTGLIPSSLGALKSLISLNLSFNHLSGEVPANLANTCGALQTLDLSNNNLSGSIPMNFSTCRSIISLSISNNNFSGGFPDILGEMQSLKALKIDYNRFEGSIPSHIVNLTNLEILDLSSNSFSLATEKLCGVESSLKALYLSNNLFTGPVPTSIGNCTQLQILDLSLNSLIGNIPLELFNLKGLEVLMMWYNDLSGLFPPEVGRYRKLKSLLLNHNNLHGPIPLELFNCSELSWISLSSNRLNGTLPPELCQLQNLSIFEASNNRLSGDIPWQLENCASLIWLDLSSNVFDGTIPPKIGRNTPQLILNELTGIGTVAFAKHLSESCRGVGEFLEIHGTTEKQLVEQPKLKTCKYRFYDESNSNTNTTVSSLLFLDISYNRLVGNISEELKSMKDLMILDLSHNSLSGHIPSSLGQLKNLEELNLAWNQLQGSIPDSLSNLTFLTSLNLSSNHLIGSIPQKGQLSTFPKSAYSQNDGLCGFPLSECSSHPQPSPSPEPGFLHPRSIFRFVLICIILLFISVSFFLILLRWFLYQKNRKQCSNAPAEIIFHVNPEWEVHDKEPLSINVATFERPLRRLDFTDLVEATKGFDERNMIGSGGFGEVYKAHLRDGLIIAVKKLSRFNLQGQRQFIAEMETLGKIHHPNLVPLLGYCKVGEERILVYEYMAGGSLEQLLHEAPLGGVRINFPWELRKKIVLDIAHGLAFLHHHCIPHVIHRDLKSSNVLLDTCLVARLSDFGMARLISALDTHNSATSLAGTAGYVPPEYYQSCKCTKEGDVYSFGVVLLEILTRKRPISKEDFGGNNIVGWVKLRVQENRSLKIFDPDLSEPRLEQDALKYLNVACNCLEDRPSHRPSMLEVVATLKELALMQD